MDSDSIYATLERAYFTEHPDEEDVLRRLPVMLAGVRHFVDIGASLGPYTLHASRILRGARIDAFEADPIRVAKLKENCVKWSATSGNVISAYHAAVAKTGGKLTFYSTQSNVSGGLFPNSLDHLNEKTRDNVSWTKIEVPAVSLDEFYAACPPQFIKMDIEGAEGNALQGAVGLLRQRQIRWLIELHGFEGGWPPEQVIDFMRSFRYQAEEVAPGRVLFTPSSLRALFKRKLRSVGGRVRRALAG
jgi:FkbM family methyltransferase